MTQELQKLNKAINNLTQTRKRCVALRRSNQVASIYRRHKKTLMLCRCDHSSLGLYRYRLELLPVDRGEAIARREPELKDLNITKLRVLWR